MEKISEIWIINEGGLPLFNKSQDNKVDIFIFGGFLSAIQTFIKTSFHEDKIDKLVLGDTKIAFTFDEDFRIYVVIRCHKKIKDKEITKYLDVIKKLFIAKYKNKLKASQSEISDFKTFNKDLEEISDKRLLKQRMKNWFDEI